MTFLGLDIRTTVIYLFISLFCAIVIKKTEIDRNKWCWLVFYAVIIAFYVFRCIGPNYGGADSLGYLLIFDHIMPGDPELPHDGMIMNSFIYSHYLQKSPAFWALVVAVRSFTKDYRVFFALSYAIILSSFVTFFKTYSKKTDSFVPYMLLIVPILYAMSGLRSWLAVAMLLFGLALMNYRRLLTYLLAFLCIIGSFGFHSYTTPAYIPFFFFFLIFIRFADKMNWKKMAAFFLICIPLGVFAAYYLRNWAISTNFNQSIVAYMGGEILSLKECLLDRWIMLFAHGMLLAAMLLVDKILPRDGRTNALKLMCMYDIAVMPAAIILNIYRACYLFYIPRIVMWGIIIKEGEALVPEKIRKLYKPAVAVLVVLWILFRIYSEASDLGVMPYYFSLTPSVEGRI